MTTHYPVDGVLGPLDLCETVDDGADGDLTSGYEWTVRLWARRAEAGR